MSIRSMGCCPRHHFPYGPECLGMKGFSMKFKLLAAVAAATALVTAGSQVALAAEPTPTSDVNSFVHSLKYDPAKVLTRVGDEITSIPPTSSKLDGGRFTVIHREKKSLHNGSADLVAINAAGDAVFPGALVRVDAGLAEGNPTVLSVPRGAVTVSVDLPGMAGEANAIKVGQATKSAARGAVASLLERWNAEIAPKYPHIAANYTHDFAEAYSKTQVQAKLGLGAALTDNLGLDFQAITAGEKQSAVASFRQVFYTASVDEPTTPAAFLAPGVQASALRDQGVSETAPPGYVSSVSYGRQIYVKMESSSTSTNVKAAFKAVYDGVKIEPGTEVDHIIKSSTFKAVVLGGSAPGQVKVLTGNLAEMRTVIEKESNYDRSNPGSPISYNVRFLKDNQQASVSTVGDYIETTVTSYSAGRLNLRHAGAYVARFDVSWDETSYDVSGNAVVQRVNWSENGRNLTAGFSASIPLPANATNISVRAAEHTGLAWEGWRTVVDEPNLPMVHERTIRVAGTTLEPTSSNEVTKS